eukprot:CAMPEP_0172165460 /NCGR_PEP_ID=MMETSP1050-20130122/8425_1 /TAXON_ID=233186 /ORGANISM="Cryptomonas curvata, Strain CCAP979/52" /LENGTH=167 /DNA_ID=CAMNT_0012835935 /DNA_START=204 /DNA_END=704 /DNA_ORIENTATION=-
MSFVARVRGTVKSHAESYDGGSEAAENEIARCAELATPSILSSKIGGQVHHNTVPELDPDELNGSGARAILSPAGSLSSAKFIGANGAFCDLFGFSRAELPISSFRILQGPLTDTKHLQEVWCEVRRGAERAAECILYSKAGETRAVRLDAVLRRRPDGEPQPTVLI